MQACSPSECSFCMWELKPTRISITGWSGARAGVFWRYSYYCCCLTLPPCRLHQPNIDRRKLAKAKAGIRKSLQKRAFSYAFSEDRFCCAHSLPPFAVMLNGVQGSLKFVDNFGIQILIYVMLAWGLNIVVRSGWIAGSWLRRLLRCGCIFLCAPFG